MSGFAGGLAGEVREREERRTDSTLLAFAAIWTALPF